MPQRRKSSRTKSRSRVKKTIRPSKECPKAEIDVALRSADNRDSADFCVIEVVFHDLGSSMGAATLERVVGVGVGAGAASMKLADGSMSRYKSWRWLRWAITGSLLPATCVSLQGAAQQFASSLPASEDYSSSRFGWYVGAGLGISRLDPDSFCDCITITDENDLAFNLYAGVDLTKRFAIEAQFAELGQSDVAFLGDSVGGVDYRVAGVTGLLYLFDTSGFSGNRALDDGLSFYVKAGGGVLDNNSRLDFIQNNDTQFWIGAGLQLGFENGWALRAEVNSFDTDAQQVTASFVKRFALKGRSSQNVPPVPVAVADTPRVVEETVTPEEPVSTLTNADLPTLYFDFDQSELALPMRWKLDQLAKQLETDVESSVVLTGHTDSLGSLNYNSALSMKRAATARDYLVSQAVDAERIDIVALGELQPAASNETDEGRSLNRRVNITLAQ